VQTPTSRTGPSGDPFAPASRIDDQVVGPLEAVTLVTTNGALAQHFFVDAMQMRLTRDALLSPEEIAARQRMLALPSSTRWHELVFDRPTVPEAIRIEVLVLPEAGLGAAGAPIRPNMNARLHGGMSLGFPVADMRAREQRVLRTGFDSTVGITQMNFPRSDGSEYVIEEIHFKGPENLYALGVWRPPELRPVGPVDLMTGIGGPAYSAQIVMNADAEVRFYRDVFGWEARRDIVITSSGPQGGLGLDAGARFRFLQLFAPGTATGYIVLMDMLDSGIRNPAEPRAPNRGLVAWQFSTHKFDELLRRVRAADVTLVSEPAPAEGPPQTARRLSMLTPSGLLVEVHER
jgi:catechol 2,3-dioxygenase-like lactoylglutathione lyase family enzyme